MFKFNCFAIATVLALISSGCADPAPLMVGMSNGFVNSHGPAPIRLPTGPTVPTVPSNVDPGFDGSRNMLPINIMATAPVPLQTPVPSPAPLPVMPPMPSVLVSPPLLPNIDPAMIIHPDIPPQPSRDSLGRILPIDHSFNPPCKTCDLDVFFDQMFKDPGSRSPVEPFREPLRRTPRIPGILDLLPIGLAPPVRDPIRRPPQARPSVLGADKLSLPPSVKAGLDGETSRMLQKILSSGILDVLSPDDDPEDQNSNEEEDDILDSLYNFNPQKFPPPNSRGTPIKVSKDFIMNGPLGGPLLGKNIDMQRLKEVLSLNYPARQGPFFAFL